MPKKSIIAVLSAVVLCMVVGLALVFTVGPLTSAADSEIILSDEKYFTIDSGGTLNLSSEGTAVMKSAARVHVKIPATINNVEVTNFVEKCFFNYSNLISVDMSETNITIINGYSFVNCTGLTTVKFPTSLSDLYMHAFEGCTSLTSIDLSNTRLYYTEDKVFANCSNLIAVAFPARAIGIDYDRELFQNCDKLTALIAPNAETCAEFKKDGLREYANLVTYPTSLQINLTDQNNLQSVQI